MMMVMVMLMMLSQIDTVHGSISDLAQDHIHAGECVLVMGCASSYVELFLKSAARKRKFQVHSD